MPRFDNGFEAWVEVDGDRLQEFSVELKENERGVPRLDCWIPSVSGKEFKIAFKLPKGQVKRSHHAFTVHVDGEIIDVLTGFIERDRTVLDDVVVKFGEKLMSDGNATRNFQFCALGVTEDGSAVGKAHEDLGELEVCHSSVSKLVKNQACSATSTCGAAGKKKTDRIHESQKKGLTHFVQLGEEKEYDGAQLDSVKYVGCADISNFLFRYRDMATLIANGKAPGRSTPITVASSSPATPNPDDRTRPSRPSRRQINHVQEDSPVEEDGGLEYVTPEPPQAQADVTTGASQAPPNGPQVTQDGVTQKSPIATAKSVSGGPNKRRTRANDPARRMGCRDVSSNGRTLRSRTLSGSTSARRSLSRRSSHPLDRATPPQEPPTPLPSIGEAKQPNEVIEISDDDDDLVAVKIEETERVGQVKEEGDAEGIHQNLREMTIEEENIRGPTGGSSRREPSTSAPRRPRPRAPVGASSSGGRKPPKAVLPKPIPPTTRNHTAQKGSDAMEVSDEGEGESDATVHDSEIEAWEKAAEALTHLAKLKSKRRERRGGRSGRSPKRVKTG